MAILAAILMASSLSAQPFRHRPVRPVPNPSPWESITLHLARIPSPWIDDAGMPNLRGPLLILIDWQAPEPEDQQAAIGTSYEGSAMVGCGDHCQARIEAAGCPSGCGEMGLVCAFTSVETEIPIPSYTATGAEAFATYGQRRRFLVRVFAADEVSHRDRGAVLLWQEGCSVAVRRFSANEDDAPVECRTDRGRSLIYP